MKIQLQLFVYLTMAVRSCRLCFTNIPLMSYWSGKFESLNIFPSVPSVRIIWQLTELACLPVLYVLRCCCCLTGSGFHVRSSMWWSHLRELQTHQSSIQGKPTTLHWRFLHGTWTGPGAQRPLIIFLTWHQGGAVKFPPWHTYLVQCEI